MIKAMFHHLYRITKSTIFILFFSQYCYPQSAEKGGMTIGTNNLVSYSERLDTEFSELDVRSDIQWQYFISDKSSLGLKFNIIHTGYKTEHSTGWQHHWTAGSFIQRLLIKSLYIKLDTGFGKDRFIGSTDSGGSGSHNIVVFETGTGINYYKFLIPNLILVPSIIFEHKILFVKEMDDYDSNQHLNNIYFGIGLYYYFTGKKPKS